jgi:hypothetical protein
MYWLTAFCSPSTRLASSDSEASSLLNRSMRAESVPLDVAADVVVRRRALLRS